jgi:hypothetical protein
MRVYVGTTLHELQALRDKGLEPPVRAHAVTPSLREWYVEGDQDELEYAAFLDAARDSLQLLAGGGDRGAGRRVVVAADVPDDQVHHEPATLEDSQRSAVRLDLPVDREHVASIHVDDDVALDDVAAAAAAFPAAQAGDEDALFTVDGADGHELAWYDVSELDAVLALPGPASHSPHA